MEKIINSKIGKLKLVYNDKPAQYERLELHKEDGEVVGFVNFKIKSDSWHNVWLYNIEVNKKYQSNGLGDILIVAFEQVCINSRAFKVEGKYYPTNEKAKPFYVKHGYEIEKDGYDWYVTKDLKTSKDKNKNEEICQ